MVEALEALAKPETAKLFEKYKVLTKGELHSRYEVYLEKYAKDINIEARAAIEMVKRQYIPAVIRYTGELAQVISSLRSAGASSSVQKELLGEITMLLDSSVKKLETLEAATKKAQGISEAHHRAASFRDKVVPAAIDLRKDVDTLETLLPVCHWPVPSYADMLFKL